MWQSGDPVLDKYLSGKSNDGVYRSSNLSLYGYSANNPILLRDPDGAEWFPAIADEQARSGAFLAVRIGKNRVAAVYTNSPRTDIQGNYAIIGGKRYRIRTGTWRNPGATEKGDKPVRYERAEVPPGGEFGAPRERGTRRHTGLDISAEGRSQEIRGRPVYATKAGRVVISRNSGKGVGESLTIFFDARGQNYDSNVHLLLRIRKKGDWVNKGDLIGFIGSSGIAPRNDHLHYRTRRQRRDVKPQTTFKVPYPMRGQSDE